MKKNFLWMALALMTTVFASCSSEDEVFDGATPNAKGQITFALPTNQGPKTYVVGNDDENKVNVPTMAIFMTDGTTVDKTYVGSDIVAGTNAASNATATITLDDAVTGTKTFYFAANATSAQLAGVVDGTTTVAELTAMLTDVQAANIDAASGLPMTAKANASIASPQVTVKLKRSVARFDVDNDAATSKVTIKTIKVSDARTQGFVFAQENASFATTAATGNLTDINFAALTGANTGANASVFYLYPTNIAGGETSVQLITEVGGVEKIFNVKAATIEANKRYTLKVKDLNKLEFELVVEDWDEGNDLGSEVSGNISAGSFSLVSGNGAFDGANWFAIKNDNSTNEFKFTVYAQSAKGVSASVKDITGTFASNINVSLGAVGALTYAAIKGYPQEVTVTVDGYNGAAEFASNIILTDLSGSKATVETRVYFSDASSQFYPGTNLKPVKVGYHNGSEIVWSPVNVGAGNILGNNSVGYFFQWGRNIPFLGNSTDLTAAGPINYADLSLYEGKFITTSSTDDSWLVEQKDDLWSISNPQGPCPNGWRLPNYLELGVIRKAIVTDKIAQINAERTALEIDGNDGSSALILPNASYIDRVGVRYPIGDHVYSILWGYETNGTKASAVSYYETTDYKLGSGLMYIYRGGGFSVRCVKI